MKVDVQDQKMVIELDHKECLGLGAALMGICVLGLRPQPGSYADMVMHELKDSLVLAPLTMEAKSILTDQEKQILQKPVPTKVLQSGKPVNSTMADKLQAALKK